MTSAILVKYLHLLSIMFVFSSLVAEHLLLKPTMTKVELKRISIIDAIYGLSAIIAVTCGLLLWFAVGKPADFYTPNSLLHLKVGLFIVVGLLSIRPTIFFLKNRKGEATDLVDIPKDIVWAIRIELLIVVCIPFLATLVANGIGR